MNFKIILFLIFLFGCGVKSAPIAPPETAIPSYVDSYLDKEEAEPNQEKGP